MLELGQLVGEIGELAAESGNRAARQAEQLDHALERASLAGDEWAEQAARIRAARTRWLRAIPLSETPTPINTAEPAPATPSHYTALATDGSQIPLDRHEIAPCYVINVGEIALHYGAPVRPRLTTRATLHYKEDDLLLDPDGEAAFIGDREIGTRRMLAEAKLLQELIRENASRPNSIALVDGTLILWAQEAELDAKKRKVIAEFVELLRAGHDAGIPVAGYLSAPGSREVVNSLRVTLCPDETINCYKREKCHASCDSIKRITDAELFWKLLSRGERSQIFRSESEVLALYDKDQRIVFFYVNVGPEIARVEIPAWVAQDSALVDRVHALVLDQAVKGKGYPVCLTEAHERAVVRGADREAFFRLVERSFAKRDVVVRATRKAFSKRTRIL